MKHRAVVLIALLVTARLGRSGWAQPTAFSQPLTDLASVEPVVADPIDLDAVLLQDHQRQQRGGPYRFAIPRIVRTTPDTDGIWEQIDDETLVWRLAVNSPGAASLSLGFSRYLMPPGGTLYVYSADHKQVLGPFTQDDNEEHGQLWTPLIHADSIVVELTVPASAVEGLQLELTCINHGYRDTSGMRPTSTKRLGDSAWCNVNVACPEGDPWRDQIRSVAKCHVTVTGGIEPGTYLGTVALINNTAQDAKPYLLTASHLFEDEPMDGSLSQREKGYAATMVVYWNFQASTCHGADGSESLAQTGAVMRSAYAATDFALVELDDAPCTAYNVYYSGWDRSSAAPSSAAAVHHPQGDLKKISIENDPLSVTSWYGNVSPGDGTHLRVADWDIGTTEGGSSGCPLFNPAKRIVGQLDGGQAACGNNKPDWFGRLHKSWTGGGTAQTRLSDWLDPLNTGVTFLDGKDHAAGGPPQYCSTDVPKNVPDPGTVASTIQVPAGGTIEDVRVVLDISHGFDQDLDVFLVGPDGTRVELFTDVGGSGDNFSCTVLDDHAMLAITEGAPPFTGRFRPEGSIDDFYGKSMSGTWTLEVADDDAQAAGTLNGWCLVFNDCLPDCHPDYAQWVAMGRPVCWCYPRQCHGDADGKKQGSDKTCYHYVGTNDLNILISAWMVKEPPHGPGIASAPNGICADFNHKAQGSDKTGVMRVATDDLNILIANWLKKEPPCGPGIPPDCLDCP